MFILTSALGGALYGGIGSAVGQASASSPVLKGALVGGAVAATLSTVVYVGSRVGESEKQVGASGVGGCPCGPNLLTGYRMFP